MMRALLLSIDHCWMRLDDFAFDCWILLFITMFTINTKMQVIHLSHLCASYRVLYQNTATNSSSMNSELFRLPLVIWFYQIILIIWLIWCHALKKKYKCTFWLNTFLCTIAILHSYRKTQLGSYCGNELELVEIVGGILQRFPQHQTPGELTSWNLVDFDVENFTDIIAL